MKMYSNEEIHKFSKSQLDYLFIRLQEDYKELQGEYENLQEDNDYLNEEKYDLEDEIENLEGQIELYNDLVDMNYLKEKLEFYGFKTEELWDFLDLYMKWYNN